MPDFEIPVLIVGGGPVGLGLAAELGVRGISCRLVEQGDGTITQPRANTVNSRTMEFCRRWGIADAVRNAGAPPDFPQTILYLTGLQGYELARIERPTHGGRAPLPTTPERSQRCNQLWFDPILRERVSKFQSVDLRYGCRFEGFEREGDGIVAELRDLGSGRVEHVHARYLVACCGGNSAVPKALGVEMEGEAVLAYHLNLFLRIPDLWTFSDKGKVPFHFFVGPDVTGNSLIELDGNQLWRLNLNLGKERRSPDEVDIEAAIHRLIGPDIPYEVISVLPWTCRSIVADRWQDGPVFLAGDAVHQHSPAGGFGMNTGMGDAVDLGWKLAASVEGWGGPALLESYGPERRPVAQRNVREATENALLPYDDRLLAVIDDDTPEGAEARRLLGKQIIRDRSKTFISDGIALGYVYEGSPVICADGTPPPPASSMSYMPSSRPGSRAPHAWVSDGVSTLDLFGRGFVLLRLGGTSADPTPLIDTAKKCGMPLELVDITDDAIADLYERALVLVRPDGHVAWRGDSAPDDALAVIDRIRGAAN